MGIKFQFSEEDPVEDQVKPDSLRFVEVNKLSKMIIEKNRYDFSKIKVNYDIKYLPGDDSNEKTDFYKKLSIRSDDELSYSDDEKNTNKKKENNETANTGNTTKPNNAKSTKDPDIVESFNNFKEKIKTKNKEFMEKPETKKFI